MDPDKKSALRLARSLRRHAESVGRMEAYPWCVTCRTLMKANGHDGRGFQRWYCRTCQATTGGRDGYGANHRNVKEIRATLLFEQGHSLREVCKLVGIHIVTAAKYRRSARPSLCRCGRDSKHQGWCWWRYQQSPKRQEFMRQWHSMDKP